MALISRRPARGIQTAIYQRLAADGELAGLGAQVRDYVDENLPHPYVSVGEVSTEAPNNWHSGFGRDTTIYVHVWSKQRAWDEANDIADRIVQVVDHQPMTVPGHRVVAVRFEFGQNLWDENPEIRHVAMRFRITTETEQES